MWKYMYQRVCNNTPIKDVYVLGPWERRNEFVAVEITSLVSYLHPNWDVLQAWWRHQMETFSALLAFCAGNSPVPGEFPTQRPVTQSFEVFFDLRPNKRLSKQSWGWWSETPSSSLWRHRNRVVLCFVTGCPYGVLGRGLNTCPMNIGSVLSKSVLNDLVCKFNRMENNFSLICKNIYWLYLLTCITKKGFYFFFHLSNNFEVGLITLYFHILQLHNRDVIMSPMASQITGMSVVCSAVCPDAYQTKHQSSASLAFVRGIHRWPVNSQHKGPVTRKMFPFDNVIIS